ncbi:hypothetical protein [Mycobacteroides abscessus]|uniref:hypothetical protein n=1 Tax=Mycobacteroides abscessus TaxID=36809 RepID=UPI00092A4417|nr:hypothetical protein [Mycobacteroides abscessus]SIC59791.1 Uncharacterised protein [Mycobacteroides abscessus subsp. abscessus]SKU87932.1 Uncharacterised protein [Mycobacteroides abscessus subsp. massiliense]SKU95980.1 Uncharacterised protein [Mycobacteroides abscessus subsp. massiliense]
MTDPAIDAAQRAIGHVSPDEFTNEIGDTALATAREALKPIREECGRLKDRAEMLIEEGGSYAVLGNGIEEALDAIAPLIFTTEELER